RGRHHRCAAARGKSLSARSSDGAPLVRHSVGPELRDPLDFRAMDAERTEKDVQPRQKLQTLRSQSIEPYQSRFDRTHSSAEAIALFEQAEKTGGAEVRTERVAPPGRLVAIRVRGGAS